MATPQEKAQCMAWFKETKSDTQVQRNFRTKYGRHLPPSPSIRAWHKTFMETGGMLHKKRCWLAKYKSRGYGMYRRDKTYGINFGTCCSLYKNIEKLRERSSQKQIKLINKFKIVKKCKINARKKQKYDTSSSEEDEIQLKLLNSTDSEGIELDADHFVGCGEEYNTTTEQDYWIQ